MDIGDIVEIQQLMALYGHVADDPDLTRLDLVFTDNAVFDASAVGWGVRQGRDAIAAWFKLGKPPHPPSHMLTNVFVHDGDDRRRVSSKWLVISEATGAIVCGDYEDVVVRTPAGWRIAERKVALRHPKVVGER
jgi:hypothetical protein